jgi:hypothetical protein
VEKTTLATRQEMLRMALGLMQDALGLLDGAECSADIGAHLDLAICRLREIIPEASFPADRSRPDERAQVAE